MKKLIKILAGLAALLVILVIAAFITLKIMFPAEKLKTAVQNYAQNTLQREVTFSGISFNLIGVTVNNLAISESKTFDQGTFLTADHVVFKMALGPLLRRRIQIKTVGLKGLDIHVVRGQDGKFNFDDLFNDTPEPSSSQDDKKTETGSPLFSLLAEHIYAKNCHLRYEDIPGEMQTSIKDLNLDIKNFDLSNPFNANLQFTTTYKDGTREAALPIKSTLTVYLADLNNEEAYVTLQNLTTHYQNIDVALKGGIKNFNQPIVNLQGTLAGLSSQALAPIIPDLPHFVLPDLSFNTDVELDLDQSNAKIVQSKLSVADTALITTGQASWKGGTTTYNTNTQINLNLTQLATMTQLLDGFDMGGQVTGQLAATDKNSGQDVRGTLTFKNFTIKYPLFTFSDVNADVLFKSLQDISSSKVLGKLNEQPFSGSFAYKDLGDVLDFVIDADLSKLKLDTFSSDDSKDNSSTASTSDSAGSTDTASTETLFNLKVNLKVGEIDVPHFTSTGGTLTANLKRASASMKQANGTVYFDLTEGTLNDMFTSLNGNKVIKILFLPFALVNKVTSKLGIDLFPAKSDEDKGKIKFSDGSGTYVFTNGIMELQETHLNSDLSNVTATGNVNFRTEKLDMRVKASVLTSQTPIVIKIGGTINDPSGKLDVAQTAVSLVAGIVNYKTPGKVAASAVGTATSVASTGVDAVKGTVSTAANTVKAIGSLFKSSKSDAQEEKQQPQVESESAKQTVEEKQESETEEKQELQQEPTEQQTQQTQQETQEPPLQEQPEQQTQAE